MTKKQKIWFAVFLAMFIIPEILWSPLRSIFLIYFPDKLPDIFNLSLFNEINDNVAALMITLAQLIGLSGLMCLIYKLKINNLIKIILFILFILFICLSANLVYMGFYYLNNYPQIG
jgi:hypothetical protein